jgi:hypothetical protein
MQHPITSGILKTVPPGKQARLEINVDISDLIKIHGATLLNSSGIVALEHTVGEDY